MKVSTTVVQEVTLDGNAVNAVFKKQLDALCGAMTLRTYVVWESDE